MESSIHSQHIYIYKTCSIGIQRIIMYIYIVNTVITMGALDGNALMHCVYIPWVVIRHRPSHYHCGN